jgi:hypothetical protein
MPKRPSHLGNPGFMVVGALYGLVGTVLLVKGLKAERRP